MDGSRFREAFWDARKGPLIFSAVTYASSISTNLFAGVVPQGTPQWWFLALAPPIAVIAVIFSPLLRKIVRPPRIEVSAALRPPAVAKGLVVFASTGDGIATARHAILYHASALRYAWIVFSTGSERSSEGHALEMIKDLRDRRELAAVTFVRLALSDEAFADAESVRRVIEEEVYGRLPDGLEEQDVVIDMTGGRKTTTAGALLAGIVRERRLEIVPPKQTDSNQYGTEPDTPQLVDIHYRLRRAKGR